MPVVKVHRREAYTVMPNGFLREKGMSYKAKGILAVMLSLPEDWDYSIAGLATLSRDGRDSVNAALQELERFGYLVRTKAFDQAGRFAGYDYNIYEDPDDAPFEGVPCTEKPFTENPYTEKPFTENPQQLITNKQNTKQTITEESVEEDDSRLLDYEGEAGASRLDGGLEGMNEREKNALDWSDTRAHVMRKCYLTPLPLTKMLIKAGYISRDDPYMPEYNRFLDGAYDREGFRRVRDCVRAFISKIKGNRDAIQDRLSYFKAAIENNLYESTPEYQAEADRRIEELSSAARAVDCVRERAENGDEEAARILEMIQDDGRENPPGAIRGKAEEGEARWTKGN